MELPEFCDLIASTANDVIDVLVQLEPHSPLLDQLGADSFELLQVILEIEDRCAATCDLEHLPRQFTAADLLAAVRFDPAP